MGWDEIVVLVGYWMYAEPEEDPEAPFGGTVGSVDGIHTDYLIYANNNMDFDPDAYADALARMVAGYIRGEAVDVERPDVSPCGAYLKLAAIYQSGSEFREGPHGPYYRPVSEFTPIYDVEDPLDMLSEMLFQGPGTRMEIDMLVEEGRVKPVMLDILIPVPVDRHTWLVVSEGGIEGEGYYKDRLLKALEKHGVLKAITAEN